MAEEENVREEMHSIKNVLTAFGLKLDTVYYALVGNDIAKDGGLVREIKDHNDRFEKIDARIEKLERENEKKKIYVNILWLAAGAIATFLIKSIFKI